jgi:hypothetical protein
MTHKYISNTSQLFDVRQYKLSGGKSDGVSAIDIWNGANLHFTVLPDRGFDIYTVRYKNRNMSFLTPSGVVAPAFYNDVNAKWLRSFGGGFLCTCGLQNIGNTDNTDSDLSLHGRISNTPAENVCVDIANDGMTATLSGVMREAVIFGANLTLKRSITCKQGCDVIEFCDTITNAGYKREPLSVLYHFNIGFPLLSENAIPFIPAVTTLPRNKHAEEDIENWRAVYPPSDDFEEMCYYHFLSENIVGIDNPDINTSVRIAFESSDGFLDRVVQWRMFGSGNYVMGLEPASCTLEGRKDAIANGSQKYINAQSSVVNRFKISFGDFIDVK